MIKRVRERKTSSLARLLKETGPKINLVSNLTSLDDFDVLHTDLREILYRRGLAKAEMMPIVDHESKLAVGYSLGETANTEVAVEAWCRAKMRLKRYGLETEGLIVHHDQDGVYWGYGRLYELAVRENVRVSYSETRAGGNVHMKPLNSRFLTENRLLFWEQEDLASLKKVDGRQIGYYNHVRRIRRFRTSRRSVTQREGQNKQLKC